MIIDLLRNDLGRVCDYGSVRVPAVCRLESYPLRPSPGVGGARPLRPGLGAVDLLRAAFPGGSVTGAPKVRAMEIIAELEPTARGPYCGSLGYLGFDGSMDTSILIRTFTLGHGWLQFPVGGGIVADSDPGGEYAETLHKAEGLLRAAQGLSAGTEAPAELGRTGSAGAAPSWAEQTRRTEVVRFRPFCYPSVMVPGTRGQERRHYSVRDCHGLRTASQPAAFPNRQAAPASRAGYGRQLDAAGHHPPHHHPVLSAVGCSLGQRHLERVLGPDHEPRGQQGG